MANGSKKYSNISTQKKTVPKKLVKGGLFKGKNFPKIGCFKMKIFCTIYPRLPSALCVIFHKAGGHRKLCVGICFSLGGFLLVEASEKNRKSPQMRSWYEVVWYVDVLGVEKALFEHGVEKALFEHPTDCCGFSLPPLWTRFLCLKVSYAIVFTRYLHEWFQSP